MKNEKKTFSRTDDPRFLKKMELQRLHKKLKMDLRFDPDNKKIKKEYDRVSNLLKPKNKSKKKDLPKK
ncbi:hypothetical protein [Flammeovirga sp. EKP202]|uniref:hypothetical protein n=1 Tax=Flammeovirga sp. EKP202 TaxID=2770592 RepID=UPI00165F2007|nr:hypothetical protein [Flammeovirga sp. EKP202]MBD0400742.1 hypothetical protein [Flammeovirga sp. EKP202]